MGNRIITIGRQFGSGGREFGRRIAEELGVDYYDKEIITEIAEHTSLSEEYIRNVVEGKPHSLYPITIGQSIDFAGEYHLRQMQSIYRAQSDIIRDLANKSSCVIVGRCADFILADLKPFRIFVCADIDSRVRRCMDRNSDTKMTEKQMKKHILRIDKDRAEYYNNYTGRRWGDMLNYDICVNTTDTVIKDIVPCVAKML